MWHHRISHTSGKLVTSCTVQNMFPTVLGLTKKHDVGFSMAAVASLPSSCQSHNAIGRKEWKHTEISLCRMFFPSFSSAGSHTKLDIVVQNPNHYADRSGMAHRESASSS